MACGALIAFSTVAATGAAEAHHYRYRHVHRAVRTHFAHYARVAPWSPAFSALLVDENSGRTLYAVAEDGVRHPASITKVMTLYLLFEQLDKGAMTLETRIPVSEHAAAQEPSKLGLEAGETIRVDDAIKAIVTRSANDIAVAVAEAIGGDERTFADMMTQKAHALGMSSTLYRNASGLPNDEQVTTARDLVILGRSLEERFPRYFKYFSTHEFVYDGEVIGSHNHLLGRVDGVDGIKTGYTRASGFNLLTSVHRDGRSLIGVVFGGRSAGARDRIMEAMIEDHIADASTVRIASIVEEAPPSGAAAEGGAREPRLPRAAPAADDGRGSPSPVRSAESHLAEGDDAEGDTAPTRIGTIAPAPESMAPPTPVRAAKTPAQLRWRKGPDAARRGEGSAEAGSAPPERKPKSFDAASRAALRPEPAATSAAPGPGGADTEGKEKGWMVQIGATDDKAKADALLSRALQKSRSALAAAKPMTEKVRKGEDTFYRARFAGLDISSAEVACRSLRRSGFACFAAPDD
jgi:D-alanyl-D-alanine carboxypeptidase